MKKLFRKLFPSKEMRAYNKMRRRQRKQLIEHAKKTVYSVFGVALEEEIKII